MSEFVDLEDLDGVRMSWNVWPYSRLEAAKCVIPFGVLYTPGKQTSQLQVRGAEAADRGGGAARLLVRAHWARGCLIKGSQARRVGESGPAKIVAGPGQAAQWCSQQWPRLLASERLRGAGQLRPFTAAGSLANLEWQLGFTGSMALCPTLQACAPGIGSFL